MNVALRPFVLKCPQCMAPTEQGSTHCRYCAVPLHWEPVSPIDRDDFHVKYPETPADLKGKCVMGFGPVAVAADSNTTIQMMPQLPVRPFRLYIPRSCAVGFYVDNFTIGMKSQMVHHNSIPAEKFSEDEKGLSMQMDPAYVGQIISLSVSNSTPQMKIIQGALDCHTLETAQPAFPKREKLPNDYREYEAWKRRQMR